ncbi:HipA domain-containing protein [Hydrogenophaga sp. BPS33]|uniref:HipA domain-containing protein n=1 Tax=Hydrogenophaga sp. BPS33 TaxID=2651974 RepID=UPI00135790F8|nr:HipA domain-containing protein [Hydrogenophaga sp. BPS33]
MHPLKDFIAPRALKQIGARIAKARRLRGWSCGEFSGQVGVSVSTVHRIEQGDPGVATRSLVNCLVVLGVFEDLDSSFQEDHAALEQARWDGPTAKARSTPAASMEACSPDATDLRPLPPEAQLLFPAVWPRDCPEEPLAVTLGKQGLPVGELRIHNSGKAMVSSFRHVRSWLAHENFFSVSPELSSTLAPHWRKSARPGGCHVFGALADTLPRGFGLRVIEKAHARGLLERRSSDAFSPLEELVIHLDACRKGALRVRSASWSSLALLAKKIQLPGLSQLGVVSAAIKAFEEGCEDEEQLLMLLRCATSLGGSQPHCSWTQEDGRLAIAKFPSIHDRYSLAKVEMLGMQLAKAAGIDVVDARLEDVQGAPVLVSPRFDRVEDGGRKHCVGARGFLLAEENDEVTYLDLLEAMRHHCKDFEADALKLWRRLMFCLLINVPCSHLEKIDFLFVEKKHWRLAPAYGIRPRVGAEVVSRDGEVQALLEASAAFGIHRADALTYLRDQLKVLKGWKAIAEDSRIGMSVEEVEFFSTDISRIESFSA